LWSRLPVISSNASCLPEVGGDAALYFDPHDSNMLAQHMLQLSSDNDVRNTMIERGITQAKQFSKENYANSMMQVYRNVLKH